MSVGPAVACDVEGVSSAIPVLGTTNTRSRPIVESRAISSFKTCISRRRHRRRGGRDGTLVAAPKKTGFRLAAAADHVSPDSRVVSTTSTHFSILLDTWRWCVVVVYKSGRMAFISVSSFFSLFSSCSKATNKQAPDAFYPNVFSTLIAFLSLCCIFPSAVLLTGDKQFSITHSQTILDQHASDGCLLFCRITFVLANQSSTFKTFSLFLPLCTHYLFHLDVVVVVFLFSFFLPTPKCMRDLQIPIACHLVFLFNINRESLSNRLTSAKHIHNESLIRAPKSL